MHNKLRGDTGKVMAQRPARDSLACTFVSLRQISCYDWQLLRPATIAWDLTGQDG
jgi:hypothetical protein